MQRDATCHYLTLVILYISDLWATISLLSHLKYSLRHFHCTDIAVFFLKPDLGEEREELHVQRKHQKYSQQPVKASADTNTNNSVAGDVDCLHG